MARVLIVCQSTEGEFGRPTWMPEPGPRYVLVPLETGPQPLDLFGDGPQDGPLPEAMDLSSVPHRMFMPTEEALLVGDCLAVIYRESEEVVP